jgi:heptosyltransferase-3
LSARSLRRALKRWAAILVSVLLGGPGSGLIGPIRRILVVRIDERVGNVLLTTPLLIALRRAFPEAELDLLVSASKLSLVADLANLIPFEKRSFFRRPWAFWRLVRGLRRRDYDVVIDASHWHHFSASSAMLLALIGRRARIIHDRGEARRFAALLVPPPDGPEPEVETKLRLLWPLGVHAPLEPITTSLGSSASAASATRTWLEDHGLTQQVLVGLAPGARKVDHRVDPEVFAALGRFAKGLGAIPVVLWGPGEEALAARVGRSGEAILAPPTNLEALASLMRRCAVVITNDTGPMHLAVAVGAPTIALFRGGDPSRWGHQHPPHLMFATDGRSQEEVVEAAARAVQAQVELALGRPPD